MGLEGGLNPYAYVGSNPVNAVDPSGLFTVGQMLDDSAMRAASMNNTLELAGLSYASATRLLNHSLSGSAEAVCAASTSAASRAF